MRILAVVFCSLPWLSGSALAQSAPARTPSVAAAVSHVQAVYARVTTFSATFEQTYFVKAYDVSKTSRGTVVFSKPGSMDWRYTDPPGTRIVSNGSRVWIYEASNRQTYTQLAGQSQYPAALSFLAWQGNANAQCDFTIYPGAQIHYRGGYVLRCDPKRPSEVYAQILFYVDAASSQVQRVVVVDSQRNRNQFEFRDVRVNTPVAPGQFVFTPPAGTAVIGAPGGTGLGPALPSPTGTSAPSPPAPGAPRRLP